MLNPPSITPTELKAMLDRGDEVELIDVREPKELKIVQIPGAMHIPLASLPDHVEELDPDKQCVVFCHLGQRSAAAVAYLIERDFEALNLAGGIHGWAREVDPSLPMY